MRKSVTLKCANGRHCYFLDLRKGINLFGPVPVGLHAAEETGMKLPRRHFLHLAAGAAAVPAVARIARAQAYPARPVRIIAPAGPGGAPDIIARLIGPWLSDRLGQQFVVENRPGSGNDIGTEVVVRAPRWLHAPHGKLVKRDQCHALRQAQFRFSSRHRGHRGHHQPAIRDGGKSIGSGQNGS